MLLIENNLRVVFAQPKSFVIPLLLQLASSTLVSGEHFVLKDLSFYEVARLVDIELRQAHLDVWEKKHQKGTLGQAPASTSRIVSNPTPQSTKKNTIICHQT